MHVYLRTMDKCICKGEQSNYMYKSACRFFPPSVQKKMPLPLYKRDPFFIVESSRLPCAQTPPSPHIPRKNLESQTQIQPYGHVSRPDGSKQGMRDLSFHSASIRRRQEPIDHNIPMHRLWVI